MRLQRYNFFANHKNFLKEYSSKIEDISFFPGFMVVRP